MVLPQIYACDGRNKCKSFMQKYVTTHESLFTKIVENMKMSFNITYVKLVTLKKFQIKY